jgi:hypothetical protein
LRNPEREREREREECRLQESPCPASALLCCSPDLKRELLARKGRPYLLRIPQITRKSLHFLPTRS